MTVIKLLSFFRLEGESLGDFAKQLRALSDAEKAELAAEVASFLGVEVIVKAA